MCALCIIMTENIPVVSMMRLTVRPLPPRVLLQAITVADVAIYQVRIRFCENVEVNATVTWPL